jgi:preprotein translocase subunit Sss1
MHVYLLTAGVVGVIIAFFGMLVFLPMEGMRMGFASHINNFLVPFGVVSALIGLVGYFIH